MHDKLCPEDKVNRGISKLLRGAGVDGDELSIGQMAKLNCVSEKTLRLYHKKGVLAPVRIDEATGYRFYSLDQCMTVDVVQQMQAIGFSLDEIANILNEDDPDSFERAVSDRLEKMEEELGALMRAKRVGERHLSAFEAIRNCPECGMISLEPLEERVILRLGICNPRVTQVDLTGAQFMEEWEVHLRVLKRAIMERGLPLTLFYHVGCIISHDRLTKRDLAIDDSFVFLNRTTGRLFDESPDRFPAGTYLTMYCDTLVDERGRYTEPVNVARLLDYASKHGYAVVGDYFGIDMAETPHFRKEGRNMIYKLCMRVETPSESI